MGNDLKSNRVEFARFGEHFDLTAVPFLHSLEKERKTRLIIGILLTLILIPISLSIALYLHPLPVDSSRFRHFRVLIYVAIFLLPMSGYLVIMSSLKQKTKLYLAKNISSFLGWNHSIEEDGKDLVQNIYSFGVLPKYSYIHINDILRGSHEYWPFTLREVILTKSQMLPYNRNRTVFKGVILSFAVRPTLSGEAVITMNPYLGHPHKRPSIKYEGVMNSLNRKITIRASSKRIMKTILCNRFQKALFELESKLPAMNLACVMYNNELHIPITAENMFEVDWLFNKMESKIRVQKMLDEFSNVLDLLDIFLKPRTCRETGMTKVPEFRYLTPNDPPYIA